MKKLNITPAMKLTERFDQQLLVLLSEELKSARPVNNKLLAHVTFKDQFSLAS